MTPELARTLTEISDETRRVIGLLVARSGHVEHVIVGDATRLYLPDIGRARAGAARLRGLRLVVTELGREAGREGVQADLLTDLQKLQLDAVVVVEAELGGFVGQVSKAHLLPPNARGDRVRVDAHSTVQELRDEDFIAFVEALEGELSRTVDGGRAADQGGTSVVLVGVYDCGRAEAERSMNELEQLARAAGANVADSIVQLRKELDPRTLLGKGKLEDVCLHTLQLGVDVLIFDADLKPSQLKHLGDATDLEVLDRTMLILDIFDQRARSHDGKLQVELARLKYSLPRLSLRQAGLSRLASGAGLRARGPGETRLEIDRRRAKDRIARLEREISTLSRRRQLRRKQRNARGLPVISIVGYTNAGKSTLLNALTNSEVHVEDILFATLDPTSRRLRFPREREVIITDTVGFIRELPRELVNAFRATLEELNDADLLWHVVDLTDPHVVEQVRSVERTLEGLKLLDKPRLVVLNKSDLADQIETAVRMRGFDAAVVSAQDHVGFERLLNRSAEILWRESVLDSAEQWADEKPPPAPRPPSHQDFAHLFAS